MDEKSALKSTTTTATKDEEWKKKKGYGRILVAVSLALLLSLYAGGHLGSGTNLRHGEMGTKNAVASSPSTSLVGSGTAASDLKTLTIVVDDDELIDGLLSVKPKGGSAAHCEKNTGYNCGAVFPPDGNTCGQKGCCCNLEDGTGYKLNSCDSAKGYAYRGCYSCWGYDACFQTSNINVGTSSCHGNDACKHASDSTIHNESCHGRYSCRSMQNSTIHEGSCRSDHYGFSCFEIENATIGKGSCNSYIENTNGRGAESCEYLVNVKIGNNSCNGKKVCYQCKHDVPDNACNQGITDDMDSNGFCNYCK